MSGLYNQRTSIFYMAPPSVMMLPMVVITGKQNRRKACVMENLKHTVVIHSQSELKKEAYLLVQHSTRH